MSMPPQLAKSKPRRPRHSEPRPTIELMPSISIHELRRVIPRYHGQINEPDRQPEIPRSCLSAAFRLLPRNHGPQRLCSTLPYCVDQDGFRQTLSYIGLQQLRRRCYSIVRPLRQLRLPLLPSSGLRVTEIQSIRPQTPHRRKTTPQTRRLARHPRTIATKAQMETPQALSSPTQSSPRTRSTSQ